jgi:[ribosomal protein S5]-alanine N-acetyltransferase
MRKIITTPRLTLRPYEAADATRVCELLGNFEVAKMLSRAPHPYALEDAQNWIAKQADLWAAGTDFVYAITTQSDGLIGAMGLHPSQHPEVTSKPNLELGYWFGQPYWGQGYATEAGRAVVEAFDEAFPSYALIAGHFTENPQSGHVLEKLGFHYTGAFGSIFCVARNQEVQDRPMLRLASMTTSNPERSTPP